MPDMKSEPSPKTYRVPSMWSGTPPCSPNSLCMVSKAISTHASRTSSPVAVITWLLMEFSHVLFSSRLEFLKAVFFTLCPFWFLSMNIQIPWKILFIALMMTPPSAVPSKIPLIDKQQPLHSLQTWINKLLKHPPLPPKKYFLNNPFEEVLSFKLLGLSICHNLSWESHIPKLASKASRQLGIRRHAKSFLAHLSF